MSEEFLFISRLLPDVTIRLHHAIINLENAKSIEHQVRENCRLLRNSGEAITIEQETDLHNRMNNAIQHRLNSENSLEQIRNEFRSISREILICSEMI